MAKEDAAEKIMPTAVLKQLLAKSKQEPVNCALVLTTAKDGLVLLDKKAKPRKVADMLRVEAGKAKVELDKSSLRFGTAEVDTEVDSALVTFKVNKEAGGTMRPKLLVMLKKAGFQKCEIIVDESLDAPDGEEAAAPAQDAGALTQRLTAAVKQMMPLLTSNPGGAEAMKEAARTAQGALRSGDLASAETAIGTLEHLLQEGAAAPVAGDAPAGPAPTPSPAPSTMGSPVFGKARATWVATRTKIEAEIAKLHQEIMKAYAGHGVANDLDSMFQKKVEPILGQLDDSLAKKLDEVAANKDAATHEKLVGEARQIIAGYEQYLAGEPLIAKLDQNPFVSLKIQATLSASLGALSKAVA